MNFRKLHYFITIVEEGKITSAAKKLNIAQPPLSQYLKKLEDEIGSKLFIRDGKHMELTEAGKILYHKGKQVLQQYEETILEARETAEGLKGTVNVGVNLTCTYYLPEKIHTFTNAFPNIKLSILEGDPYRIDALLEERSVELAIVRTPIQKDPKNRNDRYSSISLDIDPFIYVMPASWKEAEYRNDISFEEISKHPMVALRRITGKGIYELIINEFRRNSIVPDFICESPSTIVLLSLIEKGIGGAVMPRSALPPSTNRKIKILEIRDCIANTETSLIWLKDRYISKNAQNFIDVFRPKSEFGD
ncbi:LysR family transcriptional regulator [Robertmurraya massiliosenegalensis]|uniref:LysR family transcriptional regulator n=1 Tax=Robertmurraya TaxID=2837507 RepID=UPI0039A59B27